MKRLILCCDGTWNSADQIQNGHPSPTNVFRIAYRTARRDAGIPQIVYYGQGVGTGNSLDRITGGAFGKGVDDNIFNAYRFLIANYEPDDEIFLFGFSRGAFTARSIAGMIRKCGILCQEHILQYVNAVALYQNNENPNEDRPSDFRRRYSVNGERDTPIRFIGVWDTVGALGIPLRGMRWLTRGKYQFHDTELSRSVRHACHALAIDERRSPFKPTLWQFKPKKNQTVEQVWFPGVHTNIGGGYPDRSLSDITLEWMIGKSKSAGLVFDERVEISRPVSPDCSGKIYQSKKGFYRLTRGHDRDIGWSELVQRDSGRTDQTKTESDRSGQDQRDRGRTEPAQPGIDQSGQDPQNNASGQSGLDPTQSVHQSALDRWDGDPTYRPPALMEFFRRTDDNRANGK